MKGNDLSPSSTRPERRWSSYLRMAMLRLRHSWTRWSESRTQRRLAREVRYLHLLTAMQGEQLQRVAHLEQALQPLLPPATHSPPPETAPVSEPELQPELQPELEPAPLRLLDPVPPPEQELEPMPPAHLEIARLLGLQPPPT